MATTPEITSLSLDKPVWEQTFTISPLVIIGTQEEDGGYNLSPKHMVTPLGWENYYGFVCTPRHETYHNAQRAGAFTVSYPRPTQVVSASLTASPRCDDGGKENLDTLETFAATQVEGVFVKDAHLFLECEFEQVVEGFGEYGLVVGRIVAAHAAPDLVRDEESDAQEQLAQNPLLAYVNWGRFAPVAETHPFPFLRDFQR
jgi:flavin reductase (DIM6/NTAB) family NADH-FMN oxidoreductase RutF